jgi:hypothetical protein
MEAAVQRSAIALFSGGLDSMLAVRMVQAQGIQVLGIHFISPFFGEGIQGNSGKYNAEQAAEQVGIPLKVVSLGSDYLEIVRKPRHGYGKAVNPCVDCHAFFFRKAKEYMLEVGADFVITGEVLGQRPMSQRRDTLRVVERESGLIGLLVRPLSARCLPPTIPEEKGWLDRQRLGAVKGRSRKEQILLAQEFGVVEYPTPAGGCLLTETSYQSKVRDLFVREAVLDPHDFRLLRTGRHFRIGERTKTVIGRNQADNEQLLLAVRPGDTLLRWQEGPSPLALITGPVDGQLLDTAGRLLLRYTRAPQDEACRLLVIDDGGEQQITVFNMFREEDVEPFRI